jgi:hypothetical protein
MHASQLVTTAPHAQVHREAMVQASRASLGWQSTARVMAAIFSHDADCAQSQIEARILHASNDAAAAERDGSDSDNADAGGAGDCFTSPRGFWHKG